MALFGFPIFSIDNLIYRGMNAVTDTVSEYASRYTPDFAEMIGIKEPSPAAVEPSSQQMETAISPETGYPYATMHEAQNIRADLRQDAIASLQAETGGKLPENFLQFMSFNENPLFPIPGAEHQVSIFNADGTMNPTVRESILAQAASGELQQTAAKREEYHRAHEPGLNAQGQQMLAMIEDVNAKALPAEVKEGLIKNGQFAYKDNEGHDRMIDLKQPNVQFALDEIKELSQQFLNGRVIDVPNDQVVAMQTTINAIAESKQQGRT